MKGSHGGPFLLRSARWGPLLAETADDPVAREGVDLIV